MIRVVNAVMYGVVGDLNEQGFDGDTHMGDGLVPLAAALDMCGRSQSYLVIIFHSSPYTGADGEASTGNELAPLTAAPDLCDLGAWSP